MMMESEASIKLKAVDYDLMPYAFINGVGYYKKKPLPMGGLRIVSNMTFYFAESVMIKINLALEAMVYRPQQHTQANVFRFESELIAIVRESMDAGHLNIHDPELGFVINCQPEYFRLVEEAPFDAHGMRLMDAISNLVTPNR